MERPNGKKRRRHQQLLRQKVADSEPILLDDSEDDDVVAVDEGVDEKKVVVKVDVTADGDDAENKPRKHKQQKKRRQSGEGVKVEEAAPAARAAPARRQRRAGAKRLGAVQEARVYCVAVLQSVLDELTAGTEKPAMWSFLDADLLVRLEPLNVEQRRGLVARALRANVLRYADLQRKAEARVEATRDAKLLEMAAAWHAEDEARAQEDKKKRAESMPWVPMPGPAGGAAADVKHV